MVQQQRGETARRDYEELRSRDEADSADTLAPVWQDATRANLRLATETLRVWQEVTRANLNLATETLRAALSLFGRVPPILNQ